MIQKEVWILQGKAWVSRTMRDPGKDLGNSECLDLMEFWEHAATLGLQKGFGYLRMFKCHKGLGFHNRVGTQNC